MSDNPFSEPDDGERTVIRPTPGGRRPARLPYRRRAAVASRRRRRSRPPPLRPATAPKAMAMALNPLVAAAAPLLQLLARLRNTVNQPDPGDLRERAVRAMRAFEQRRATPACRSSCCGRRITRCAPASTTWC